MAEETTAPPKAKPVDVEFEVSSYAPSGDGFRDDGGTWTTATYTRPNWGNLKEGGGLVLDLGSAKEINEVSFDAGSGPITVQLRSADSVPSGSSKGKAVGSLSKASGKTTLDGTKGGKHQYWMIWVTDLGPPKKGEISDLKVTALEAAS